MSYKTRHIIRCRVTIILKTAANISIHLFKKERAVTKPKGQNFDKFCSGAQKYLSQGKNRLLCSQNQYRIIQFTQK